MKILLDTHVFLWWITDSNQLSQNARSIISNPENEIFLSAASCWEMAIKASLGRLTLPEKPDSFIPAQLAENNISGLPVQLSHALAVCDLPMHHRDPFDRILVAQARLEKMTLMTSDSLISMYDVYVIW
jgi:PIN domain nuclease of toxin-antitoxin system